MKKLLFLLLSLAWIGSAGCRQEEKPADGHDGATATAGGKEAAPPAADGKKGAGDKSQETVEGTVPATGGKPGAAAPPVAPGVGAVSPSGEGVAAAPAGGNAPPHAPDAAPPPKVIPDEEGWPGVATDLAGKAPLYLARVTRTGLGVWRKPKADSGSFWTLSPGHIVEVLAEEAPAIELDGIQHPAAPIRFGGFHGWTLLDGLERLEAAPADGAVLWGLLRESLASEAPDMPADCPAALLLADLIPGGPPELLVHAPGRMECRSYLAVFDLAAGKPVLLDAEIVGDTGELTLRPWGNGDPLFVEVLTYFMVNPSLTGNHRKLLRLVDGKLRTVRQVENDQIDSRGDPVQYLIRRFAYPEPEGQGRWMIQQKTTLRSISAGKESDEVREEFFRYDGESFVPTPRPAGIPELPAEPPSIESGPAQ